MGQINKIQLKKIIALSTSISNELFISKKEISNGAVAFLKYMTEIDTIEGLRAIAPKGVKVVEQEDQKFQDLYERSHKNGIKLYKTPVLYKVEGVPHSDLLARLFATQGRKARGETGHFKMFFNEEYIKIFDIDVLWANAEDHLNIPCVTDDEEIIIAPYKINEDNQIWEFIK